MSSGYSSPSSAFSAPGSGGSAFGTPQPSGPASGPASGKGDRKGKGDKSPSKKVLSTQKKAATALAVLTAGFVVMLGVSAKPATVYVARAKVPVNAFETLNTAQIEAVQMDKSAVEPGALQGTSASAAIKAALSAIGSGTTRAQLFAGEQLHGEMFASAQDPVQNLAPNERLVSVSAAVSSAVGGSIVPGDYVDVIASETTQGTSTNIILSNVQVVKVTLTDDAYSSAAQEQASSAGRNQSPSQLLPGNPIPGTYVLRVKDTDVVGLVAANTGGKLSLVLRPQNATTITPGAQTAHGVICGPVTNC